MYYKVLLAEILAHLSQQILCNHLDRRGIFSSKVHLHQVIKVFGYFHYHLYLPFRMGIEFNRIYREMAISVFIFVITFKYSHYIYFYSLDLFTKGLILKLSSMVFLQTLFVTVFYIYLQMLFVTYFVFFKKVTY